MKTIAVLATALSLGGWGCANFPSTLPASDGRERQAGGSTSPPLEERVGERRPVNLIDAAVRGDMPVGYRTNSSGALAENHGLLSPTLSSKGGEGSGAAANEHRAACKDQNLPADQARAVPLYEEVHQRATNEFAEAAFFKPAEPKTNDLTSSLAPLILQEVNGGKAPLSRHERFGTLSLSNGVLALDRSRPAIYWQADSIQLKGRAHVRLSYLWCYALAPAGQPSGPTGLPWQGIRVTFNLTGQPVIWEVLADGSGAELIYISRWLNSANRCPDDAMQSSAAWRKPPMRSSCGSLMTARWPWGRLFTWVSAHGRSAR
jgi:hypothetical protein